MLKLYVPSESGYLDTTGVSLQLNFSESDLRELAKPVRPHSLAFKLPFTERNNRILQFLEVIDNSVETRGRIECEVYDGDSLVMAGGLSVRSADLQARTYDCVIYSGDAGVWQKLKKTRWPDVFTTTSGAITTALDHNHDAANIKESNKWTPGSFGNVHNDITDGGVGDDIVWYCPQITGVKGLNSQGGTTYIYLDNAYFNAPTGVPTTAFRKLATDYTPSFQVTYLLQQLMDYLGYTLQTNFDDNLFNSEDDDIDPLFYNLYYMPAHSSIKYRPYYGAYLQAYDAAAFSTHPGWTSGTTFSTGTGNAISNWGDNYVLWFAFDGTSTTGGGYDPDGWFPGGGMGLFEPLTIGSYTLRMKFDVTLEGTINGFVRFGVRIFDFGAGGYVGGSWVTTIPTDEASLNMQVFVDFTLYYGTTTSTYAFVPVWQVPNGVTSVTFNLSGTYIEVVSYDGESRKIQVPSSLGEDTCDKFLSGIMQQFNLLMTFDEGRKTCRLHRRRDFYEKDLTNALDWTEKVDRSKSMTLTNNLENINKQVSWTLQEGSDGRSKWWQEILGKRFADYTYLSGLEYATGEQKVQSYFAPARFRNPLLTILFGSTEPDSVTDTEYDHPMPIGVFKLQKTGSVESNGTQYYEEAQNAKPLLVYKHNERENSKPIRIYDSMQDGAAYEDIGDWTSVNVRSLDGATYLSFAPKTSYDGLSLGDADSIYRVHFEQDIKERYSIDARVLTCSVHLSDIDIANLKYSDLIYIEGTYYYVLSISNYVVGKDEPCALKLRKYLTGGQVRSGGGFLCSGVVTYTISDGGAVTFLDRFGVEVTATEGCCAYFGGGNWTWNAYSENCLTETLQEEDAEDDVAFRPNNPGNIRRLGDNLQEYRETDGTNEVRRYRFSLSAATKGHTTAQAKNSQGDTSFHIGSDCAVGIEVSYVCRITSDTNFGDMQFGETRAAFKVVDDSISKTAADDKTKQGDASSIDVAVSVTNADGAPRFSIDCTGHTGDDLSWQFDVVMRVQDITTSTTTNAPSSIIMQDGNVLVTEDGDLITYP